MKDIYWFFALYFDIFFKKQRSTDKKLGQTCFNDKAKKYNKQYYKPKTLSA